MRFKILTALLAMAASCGCKTGLAQTRSGATMEFLDVPQVTRLVGSGGMHVAAVCNSSAMLFHNPAGVTDTTSGYISLSISPVAEGIKYASAAYTQNIGNQTALSAGILYAGYGDFTRTDEQGNEIGTFTANEGALYLSVSKTMAPWLRLGATLKPIYSKLADYTSFALAMDFGADLSFADGRLKTALAIRNIGAVVKRYSDDDAKKPLPADVKITFAYKTEHAPFRILVTLKDLTEWDLSPKNKKLDFGDNLLRHTLLGLEFTPVRAFYFAFGYDQRKRRELTDADAGGAAGFSWGMGLHIAKIDIQYSHSRYHVAGSLNSITLATNWRKWVK